MKKRYLRALSLFMILAMLLPLAVACKKDPETGDDDEIDDRGDTPLEDYVFKIEEKSSQKVPMNMWYDGLTGVEFDTDIKRDGEDGSLYWKATSGGSVSSLEVSDWTSFDTLTFWVYSAKACGATLQIRFSSPNIANTSMDPYTRYKFTVDWTGWKEFRIPLDDFAGNYDPNMSKLQKMYFDCSGWELESKNGCELYFSYMYLEKTRYEITPSLDSFDDEIYTKLTDNWRKLLVGNEKTNSSGSEATASMIASVNSSCKYAYEQFNETFSANERDSLFGIQIVHGKSGDEAKIRTIYSKLYAMARGYAMYGSDYYQDHTLYNKIRMGLEYCYKYYYGPCVEEQGTFGNWWEWDIGTPLILTKILILLEKPLGSQLVAKYLEPFDYLNKYPSMTACNKVWISYCCLASAALQKDGERLLISEKKMLDVFDYVVTGDGFYTDGSFVQHEAHPYSGGYGLSMLSTLVDIMYVLNNTRFQMIDESVNNQYSWVFDTFQPIIYNGNLFANVRGREVYRNTSEAAAGKAAIVSMITMAQYAPDSAKAQLESLIKCYLNSNSTEYEKSVSIAFSDYTTKLRNDDSVQARNSYNKTFVFGNMDRVTSHNEKYGVSISLNSTRIWKYEAINGENMNGWYLGDGMIYIYTDGYDYDYDFYHYVDKYKLPGTTVSSAERKEENVSGGIYNGSAFAGGVTIGEYGIAVLDLTPSKNNYFNSKLYARKSYFMFDNEIVALGSGIKDTSGYDISTIIENRKWNSSDKLTVNGSEINLNANNAYTKDVTSMHFTNMGGYVFFDSVKVKLEKATTSGTTFFEAWVAHGTNPKGESYSYVYLPEATVEETTAYQQSPDVKIISNTDKVHAVQETKLGVTGYVFWEAGSCNGVTVDSACTLMVKEENGKVTVSVSDPTHSLENAKITIKLSSLGSNITSDSNINATVNGDTLTLDVDFLGNVGQSFTVTIAQ